MKKKRNSTLIFFGVVVAALIIINYVIAPIIQNMSVQETSYSEFLNKLGQDSIQAAEIYEDKIIYQEKTDDGSYGTVYSTLKMEGNDVLAEKLYAAGVEFTYIVKTQSVFTLLLSWIVPLAIMAVFWIIILRVMSSKMGGGTGSAMSFGKNTAKIYAETKTGKSFADVAGQDEAKESLQELVAFLKQPEKYASIGAKLPKGALLVGPPGTGKTLLAKAVAGEAGVPFFSISGSEFVEMFVGVGASRVRDLFKQATEKAPCIVFIDEIDTIGKSRNAGQYGGNDEREQTLNQLLSEMDGFDSSKGVIILAATNRPEVLDKALLRPGRFDRRIIVELPDLSGREAILRVHARSVKMGQDVDFRAIARSTSGVSGAELANIINEAAINAVRNNRGVVHQSDLHFAVDLVLAGAEKKNTVLSDKEKRIVAYHEIGHALISVMNGNPQPVEKITIVPRTMGALGFTMQSPEEERYLLLKDEALDKIKTMLGGRAAEEVKFNNISSGAANDIEKATQLARNMVTRYGMSDHFDMMGLSTVINPYLSDDMSMQCSQEAAARVDNEVLEIIRACHAEAKTILEDNLFLMDMLASALLEKETLTGDDFRGIIDDYHKSRYALTEATSGQEQPSETEGDAE